MYILFRWPFGGTSGYDLSEEQFETLNDKQKVQFTDEDFIFSAIIGEVDIVDCVLNHSSIWADSYFEPIDETEGYKEKPIYNWVLANPVLYKEPILNVKGKLSFWEFKK